VMNIDRVLLTRFGQYARRRAFRNAARNDGIGRLHFREIKPIHELMQDAKLRPERGAASARRGWFIREIAVFVSSRERIIEVVIKRATRDQEIPALKPVYRVGVAIEPGFVVADRAIE